VSALALEHSQIHLAQVEDQFQPLARAAHQLFIASLTSSFKRLAQSVDFVLLRSQSFFEIILGHDETTQFGLIVELRGRPASSNFLLLSLFGAIFSEAIIPELLSQWNSNSLFYYCGGRFFSDSVTALTGTA
jgi:hypothetical protein